MKLYVVMVEKLVCAEAKQCSRWDKYSCDHAKRAEWEIDGRVHTKTGPAMTKLNGFYESWSRHEKNMREHQGCTGNCTVFTCDTNEFKPWMDDAEVAAYRIGGSAALAKIRKAREREAAKAAQPPKPSPARRRVCHGTACRKGRRHAGDCDRELYTR